MLETTLEREMRKTNKQGTHRKTVRRFSIPKRPLFRVWLVIKNRTVSLWKRFRHAKLRYQLIAIAAVLLLGEVINIIGPLLTERAYALGTAEELLVDKTSEMAEKITYDQEEGTYTFTGGATTSNEALESGKTAVTSVVYRDSSKGVSVTDSINQIEFSMTPSFSTNVGRQDSNRIVFPLTNGQSGWLVYTVEGTGLKEDILLNSAGSNELTFDYTLNLGDSLQAKMETDGSIGIYGNTLLSGNVATSTDSDAALLQKARQNAAKTTYLFGIPAPTITEPNSHSSNVSARYELNGSKLTLRVTNLKTGTYPLTIDPSIYVVTAQQFMAGNNETNINFDVDNKLIKKGRTTGARFNSWTTTSNLPAAEWNGASVAAGGYLYTIGGVSFNGQVFTSQGAGTFTVPSGVTSLTVKMWGGGGGGGGGGSNAAGGAGGGGGYTTATFTVIPGETLNVYVGGGGGAGTGSSSNAGYGGGGGGASTIYRDSDSSLLALAAAGGGGGGGRTSTGDTGGAGGAGGGDTGATGSAAAGGGTNNGGSGGTQSTGGSVGSGGRNPGVAGSSLTGGDGGNGQNSGSGSKGGAANGGLANGGAGGSRTTSNYAAGGGGGAGYYGGAGGNGGTTAHGGSGGGGGSSYYTGTGSNTAGSGTTPGNSGDSYRNGAADGGAAGAADASGTAGDNGLVVVTYGAGGSTASQSVNWAQLDTGSGTIVSANPGTGTCSGWCTTSAYNLPSARSNFSLVAYNGFLYAMGGQDASNAYQSTVYVAKLGANGEPQLWHPSNADKSTWVYWYQDTGLSNTRAAFSAVAYNNRMYVVGGLTNASTATSTVQIATINPNGTLSSWTTSTALGSAVYGHDMQVYNDRLYVMGGSTSVGGAPVTSVYYNKINGDGSLNSWQTASNAMKNGRMQSGGKFSVIWGAYLYVSGGCDTVNVSGYCTNIRSDTQVASINADGSIDVWNVVGGSGVVDQRMGHSLLAWRDNIYEIGGCNTVSSSDGTCNVSTGLLNTINYGTINQDGEASTVADSTANSVAPCSGSYINCNLPGTSYIGNVLSGSAIMNGYMYIWGGCSNTNANCGTVSQSVAYTAINTNGSISRPSSCGSWSAIDSYCYNTTSLPGAVAAPGTAVANGYLYSIGGFTASGMVGNIYYTAPDATNGSISSWTSTGLTGIGATSVSYPYSFARANPAYASSIPNNLYIIGGCINATGIGCPSSTTGYTDSVYKCNLSTTGVPSTCTKSGQLQIGTVPGASAAGLGAMAGTVYANYIYLMGGLTYGNNDLKTTRYAKLDNDNNIVAVSGSAWVESANQTYYGRRRGAGFGYNGYLYVVGGFDGSSGGGGVLADIEFAKINVSDGSIGTWNVSTVSIDERWGLALAISNSYAYVIGGCINGDAPNCASGGQTNSVQTFQVYNNDSGAPAGYSTAANTYTTNPNRIGVSATVLNGYLYVAGGNTGATEGSTPTANVAHAAINADGSLGSWSAATDTALPIALAWGKLLAAGGSLYYVGGQDANGASQSTVYYATPSSGTISSWTATTTSLPASRTQFGAAVWNNRLYIVGGYTGTKNQLIYNTADSSTFTVPSGITSITVKAWGAGGGGGTGSGGSGSGGNGGGGGYATSTLTGLTGGTALTVMVGSGGTTVAAASNGGNGGGFSAVLNGSTYLIQAGGGGGGGGTQGSGAGGTGGVGGGATAGNGTAGGGTTGGGLGVGGSGSAGTGGSAGTSGIAGNSGAANQGGDAGGSGTTCTTAVTGRGGNGGTGAGGKGGTATSCSGGGGGGSGRYGGGGGGSVVNTTNRGGGGGGGGSGLTTGTNPSQANGSGTSAGNNTDAVYNGTAGIGGSGSTGTTGSAGADGLVVISYGSYTTTNTVYVSPQLNTGGNITGSWTSSSTAFTVARSNPTVVAYANNLYVLGGYDGTYYLGDTQYAQIDNGVSVPANAGNIMGSWTYSQSLPTPIAGGDGFAVNGYIYVIGGRTADTVCTPSTLVAPISANTTIASGNNPTGVGAWYAANQRYTGNRYGNAAVYNDGKAYVLGGGCGIQTSYASPVTQQTALLTQPQVAKYSIMFDTDSDVYANAWLLNGVDNSIGARWQLKYQSMTDPTASGPNGTGKNCSAAIMSTWGQTTNFGNVTLMQPGVYTPKDGSGTSTNCARYYYFSISVDSSQAFGYPDDVSRGPTITDLTLQFTADPAKRLMHGRTFVGGLQMPDDTPFSVN